MLLYAHALHYICIFTVFHAFRCVFLCWKLVLVGMDWVEPMMNFSLHVTCSCIVHSYVPFLSHIWYSLLMMSFLSLSLSLGSSAHGTQAQNYSGTLFVPGHHLLILLLFLSGFVMRRPVRTSRRTSQNMAFIWNAV